MPLVYGSSSNLFSTREKKKKSTASKALQVSTLFSCIVFLIKKEFFGTTEALSHLPSLFFNPSQLSNSGFQPVTFPFLWRPARYFGLDFPADCSAFPPALLCGEAAAAVLAPRGITRVTTLCSSPQPCCSWGAVCSHRQSQTPGSLSHLCMDGQNPSTSDNSH